jgi:D-xylose transport system substrate-binding protein
MYMDDLEEQKNNDIQSSAPVEEVHTEKTSRILLLAVGVAGLLLLFVAVFGIWKVFFEKQLMDDSSVATEESIRIGLSLETTKIPRWKTEADFMTEAAEKAGATVVTFVAESDNDTQIAQVQNLIAQKVDVLIVNAHDGAAIAPIVDMAHQAGIKVIAYDRLILNSELDSYVSFDSEKVGEYSAEYALEAIEEGIAVPKVAYVGGPEFDNNANLVRNGAMQVLQPLAADGAIEIVFDKPTVDWSPSEAYKNFKQFLDEGGEVDAVVTSYDGVAFGVIQALQEKGLAGKVPVTAQDAELPAIKRLIQGTQTMTCYKPGKLLAEKAIEIALDFANNKVPNTNTSVYNGEANVDSYLYDVIPVTKDNIESTVISDGYHSREDVYGSS